ncbi:hypothetical protein B0H66DRAFT_516132 [Apodospora peruviana]|uniref:Heterokaryon incompatibility domain-containing protein n=1 Tax=Apodospora peruviana TaxID=516989 RepID=A0AAE0I3R4_9PEZI|nr:hypothetical protein B0H66DRAFT_516132 [Apodospora peruviana]
MHEEDVAEDIVEELPPKQKQKLHAKYQALCERDGYKKIHGFAQLARNLRDEYRTASGASTEPGFVWVDTCCINKESSAELSEAVNSMYRWFHNAYLYIAFLGDVVGTEADLHSDFGRSRWFTRDWTLQELLAPGQVYFYNGTKTRGAAVIYKITGIHHDFLTKKASPIKASIAIRMSWAAARQTTRVEDETYCLMGIFNVNMPVLYGEGKAAVFRLQQEII